MTIESEFSEADIRAALADESYSCVSCPDLRLRIEFTPRDYDNVS